MAPRGACRVGRAGREVPAVTLEEDAGQSGNGTATGAPRRKSDLTRQRILEAAARMFRAKGYSGARLTEIAKLAGIQVGSLYYHFRSREALVAEVMAIGLAQTVAAYERALDALPAEADSATRIRTAVETHVLQLIEPGDFPGAMLKLAGEVPPDLRDLHRAGERAYGRMWQKLLEQAHAAGVIRSDANISVLRLLILGAMNWSIEWYRPGAGPAPAVARQCSNFVLHGLLREPPRG